MPYKPKRPCAYPGCGRLAVREQYCAEHQKVMDKRYNQYERDPASNKRYGRSWKRIRDRYIKAHPLCEECLKQGKLTPAAEVHHILPLSKGGKSGTKGCGSDCWKKLWFSMMAEWYSRSKTARGLRLSCKA